MINNFADPWFLSRWLGCAALATVSLLFFMRAIKNCQKGRFYTNTPQGFLLGIYVWGDALILGPFWLLSAVIFLILPPVMVLRYLLLFFSLRAVYETIYWLNHQAVKAEYQPPLFKHLSWVNSNEAAILYQLLNFCLAVILLSFLIWSFWW